MRFLSSLLAVTVLLVSGCSPDASATPNAPAAPKAASPKTASYALTYFTMPG
jgi:hypothetical protein